MGLKLITGLALLGVTAGVTAGVTQSNANVKIKDLEKQNSELVTQLENEKSDKQKYYDALVESAQTLEAKNILIENLTSTLNTTQTDLTTATNNLNLKQSELNSKIEELNIANSNVENLQSLLDSANEDKVLIQEQLDTALQNKSTLETEVATLTSERDALQIRIDELTEENNSLKLTITELENQIKDLIPPTPTTASYFTFNNNQLTGYVGPEDLEEIVIPKTYSLDEQGNVIDGTDYEVTKIFSASIISAFSSFKGSFICLENITSIDRNAFDGCSFDSIDLSRCTNMVTLTGLGHLNSLNNLILPNSLNFIDCQLSNYNLKFNIDEANSNLLYLGSKDKPYLYLVGSSDSNITNLENINSQTKLIAGKAFSSYTSLTSFDLSNTNILSIGEQCFSACTNLATVNLNNSKLQYIGENAFNNTSLNENEFNIPESIITIGRYAFGFCKFKNIDLSICKNLEKICYGAFMSNSNLESIYIPSHVTNVEAEIVGGISTNVKIYCESSSKPDAWADKWNAWGSKTLSVEWGVTAEEYAEIIAGTSA